MRRCIVREGPREITRIIHVNAQGLVALNVVLSHNSLIRSSRYIAAKMAKIANKVVFFLLSNNSSRLDIPSYSGFLVLLLESLLGLFTKGPLAD